LKKLIVYPVYAKLANFTRGYAIFLRKDIHKAQKTKIFHFGQKVVAK